MFPTQIEDWDLRDDVPWKLRLFIHSLRAAANEVLIEFEAHTRAICRAEDLRSKSKSAPFGPWHLWKRVGQRDFWLMFHHGRGFIYAMRRFSRLFERIGHAARGCPPEMHQRIQLAWRKRAKFFESYRKARDVAEHMEDTIEKHTGSVFIRDVLQGEDFTTVGDARAGVSPGAVCVVLAALEEIRSATEGNRFPSHELSWEFRQPLSRRERAKASSAISAAVLRIRQALHDQFKLTDLILKLHVQRESLAERDPNLTAQRAAYDEQLAKLHSLVPQMDQVIAQATRDLDYLVSAASYAATASISPDGF